MTNNLILAISFGFRLNSNLENGVCYNPKNLFYYKEKEVRGGNEALLEIVFL